jgi:GNAT superfamily N-acetyltransferase
MIEYKDMHEIDLDQLEALLRTAGWIDRVTPRERLAKQVSGSMFVVSAWEGEKLVGFARAISDGATNAYVSTVVVAPELQGRGVGRELLAHLVEGRDGIQFVLHARPAVHGFYLKNGFEPAEDMFRRRRKF